MSTVNNPLSSILSSVGAALLPDDFQTQLAATETQVAIGISTLIGLELVIAIELLFLVVIAWKER